MELSPHDETDCCAVHKISNFINNSLIALKRYLFHIRMKQLLLITRFEATTNFEQFKPSSHPRIILEEDNEMICSDDEEVLESFNNSFLQSAKDNEDENFQLHQVIEDYKKELAYQNSTPVAFQCVKLNCVGIIKEREQMHYISMQNAKEEIEGLQKELKDQKMQLVKVKELHEISEKVNNV